MALGVRYMWAGLILSIGVVCIWASYRLSEARLYMRASGMVFMLVGLYFLYDRVSPELVQSDAISEFGRSQITPTRQ